MIDSPILYLIRHGRTEMNSRGLFRGKADPALSSLGVKDAEEIPKYLEDHNIQPAFIASSDKLRALQTSKIINTFRVPEDNSEKLRAWNLGKFSGQPKNEENVAELETYIQNPDLPIPEGESLNEFRDRIIPILQECFKYALQNGVGFVVAHSSVIHETGTQLNGDHTSLVVEPGGIVAIGFGDGKIVAQRIFKPLRRKESAASVS